MSNTGIQIAKNKARELQKGIAELIAQFESSTEMHVDDIEVLRVNAIGQNPKVVDCHVEISLNQNRS